MSIMDCPICLEPDQELHQLPCGHPMCTGCYLYLQKNTNRLVSESGLVLCVKQFPVRCPLCRKLDVNTNVVECLMNTTKEMARVIVSLNDSLFKTENTEYDYFYIHGPVKFSNIFEPFTSHFMCAATSLVVGFILATVTVHLRTP